MTPARDMTLHFNTWTDFASDCGQSRYWGGVHFPAAVDASAAYCSAFGDMAFEYYQTLMDGTAPVREPAQALDVDPWLATSARGSVSAIVVPDSTTPTPEVCQNVSDSVVVTAMNSGVECEPLETSGLGLLTGFLDAVDVSGELALGVQVCFRNHGTLLMFENTGTAQSVSTLTSYNVSGTTCAFIDRPGLVVLVSTGVPLISSSANLGVDGENASQLFDCRVTTTHRLNFRAAPDGIKLNEIVPHSVTLIAYARTDNWFNVSYGGSSGWISADYVRASGTCQ